MLVGCSERWENVLSNSLFIFPLKKALQTHCEFLLRNDGNTKVIATYEYKSYHILWLDHHSYQFRSYSMTHLLSYRNRLWWKCRSDTIRSLSLQNITVGTHSEVKIYQCGTIQFTVQSQVQTFSPVNSRWWQRMTSCHFHIWQVLSWVWPKGGCFSCFLIQFVQSLLSRRKEYAWLNKQHIEKRESLTVNTAQQSFNMLLCWCRTPLLIDTQWLLLCLLIQREYCSICTVILK